MTTAGQNIKTHPNAGVASRVERLYAFTDGVATADLHGTRQARPEHCEKSYTWV